MPTADDVIRALASGDGARPRLTHYDDSGRIELSGRVLLNWVAKAANLLQEEFDAGVGSRIAVDLAPTHWRTAYWALATWAVGATMVTRSQIGDDVTVVVTDQVAAQPHGELVVVTMAALARRSPSPLPQGALDEAAVLSTYGDVLDPWDSAPPQSYAWTGEAALTFADLVPKPVGATERVLIPVAAQRNWTHLRTALSVWAGDGSVVVAPAHQGVERIGEQEGVTRRVEAG